MKWTYTIIALPPSIVRSGLTGRWTFSSCALSTSSLYTSSVITYVKLESESSVNGLKCVLQYTPHNTQTCQFSLINTLQTHVTPKLFYGVSLILSSSLNTHFYSIYMTLMQGCQLTPLGWRLQHFGLISSINLPEVCISSMESPAFCAQFFIHTSTEFILHLW